MIWGREDEILVGYRNGIVSSYDTVTLKYGNNMNQFKDEGSIVGLGYWDQKVIVTSSKGKISIMDHKNKIKSFMTPISEDGTLEASSQNINKMNIIATGGESNDLKLWDVETKQCVFKAKSVSISNFFNSKFPNFLNYRWDTIS